MTDPTAERELGGFRAKFFLAVGSIGWGVKDAGITGLLLLFYSQIVGVSAQLVGLAIGVALVVDAVVDPIIGIVSDNWRSRWGRRLPFMYAAAFPVGITYFFLWQPPAWSAQEQFEYLLVLVVLARLFIALFEIPSSALIPELTSDYTKRTAFLNWRWFMGVLGAAFIGFVSLRFILVPDQTHPIGQLNPAGYPLYALVASTIMTLSILISCLGLHRYTPHFLKPAPRHVTVGQFAREILQTLRLKSFRILTISGFLSSAAIGLAGALGPILLTYYWKLNNVQIAPFSLATVIGALFAFIVFVPLAKFFEKKIAAIVTSIISIAAGTGPYVFALSGWTPDVAAKPELLLVLLGLFAVFAAMGITASVLVGSMMADVVDQGAVDTGRRSEGTLFAAISLVSKASSGIGVFLGGMITGIAGLPAHAVPSAVDPHILERLLWLYVPSVVLLHAGAIYAFSRFGITRKHHEENRRRLDEQAEVL